MCISNESIRVAWNLPKKTSHVWVLEIGILQNEEKKSNQILYVQSMKDDMETFW